MKTVWVLSYLLSAQLRLWSDWADAKVDLSLRWANMSFCWFCHDSAHIEITRSVVKCRVAATTRRTYFDKMLLVEILYLRTDEVRIYLLRNFIPHIPHIYIHKNIYIVHMRQNLV